jgi:ADP-dependent NAD(P)H-hydrate dehydratase / NAD(P)H-hydrate epimerase
MGAAVLCAKACLRSGIGLLTMHIPRCGYEILQMTVPEAMVSIDNEKNLISGYPDLKGFTTIGIGPGIGTNEGTVNMLGKILENSLAPTVLDADALNIISKNQYLMEKLPRGSILTPHLVEFERIAGTCYNHFERIEKQRLLSVQRQIVIILKGAHSSISLPDGSLFFNSTGNPGMAKGGSGDVLTGIVTALLGQNYTPEEAAILGVYIHGFAADISSEANSQEGLIASDIVDYLPTAFKILKN